ncbi:MAG: hypothetical protein KF739_04700 [Cryobacterium sp.]|nr:hypothetical protein [Cryobacterium sp.]
MSDAHGFPDSFDKAYLRAGSEPGGSRVWRNGEDITEQPELWTEDERQRREAWLIRKARLLEEIAAEDAN